MRKLALNLLALGVIGMGVAHLDGPPVNVALHDTAAAQSRVERTACCTSGDGDRCCSEEGCTADEDSCQTF